MQPTGLTGNITPKALSVIANNQQKSFGATDPLNLTFTYSGLAAGDNSASFSGVLARATGETSGTYVINQGSLQALDNYMIGSFSPGIFTILAAPITTVNIPDTVLITSQVPMPILSSDFSQGKLISPELVQTQQNEESTEDSADNRSHTQYKDTTISSIVSLTIDQELARFFKLDMYY